MTGNDCLDVLPGIIGHPACLLHEMGANHPESPRRIQRILKELEKHKDLVSVPRYESSKANREQLQLAHDSDYIATLFDISPNHGQVALDSDTSMNPHSLDAALYATGACCQAVDRILSGENQRLFCLVRPPGHHAERARAMGFCFFNSVAVAALYAREQHGLQRIAIVDFDVHHGNGTEDIIAGEAGIEFFSTFQSPFYPFSGTGNVASNVHNSALAASASAQEFRSVIESDWLPMLAQFEPQLIIISAGFDGHQYDNMSSHRLTESDYAWVTGKLVEQANTSADGRIISSLEGGYGLDCLATSVAAHLKSLFSISGY